MTLLFFLLLLLTPFSRTATWFLVQFNGTSWKDATPTNTHCAPDPAGNYVTQQACLDTLPQPQIHPPCQNCATMDDVNLIVNYDTWARGMWSQIYQNFGFTKATDDSLWSPLQIAKIWIVGTIRNATTPIISDSPKYSSGGALSCVNALTVGLQEGGTTGVDGTVTYPYNDGSPRNIYDPAWNLGGSPDALCASIGTSTSEQCISGSIWQVSNAWAGNTCDACDQVGCQSLQNPLCATRVSFQFAKMAIQNQPCQNLVQSGATECTAQQYHEKIDPKCFNGPFCLDSNGWNSPACYQMFRQVYANEGSPYCRLAIEACQLARQQLLSAYAQVVINHPSFLGDYKQLQGDDARNVAIEAICPMNPGDYSVQPPQCT